MLSHLLKIAFSFSKQPLIYVYFRLIRRLTVDIQYSRWWLVNALENREWLLFSLYSVINHKRECGITDQTLSRHTRVRSPSSHRSLKSYASSISLYLLQTRICDEADKYTVCMYTDIYICLHSLPPRLFSFTALECVVLHGCLTRICNSRNPSRLTLGINHIPMAPWAGQKPRVRTGET